jgi:transcriptional regulator with XRE-family HTH domain
MEEAIRIGPEIRERRVDAGLSQRELAEKADVSEDYIGRLERDARVGSLTVIVKLAKALDCDPGDLIRKRARLTPVGDSSVLAVRDAIYDPQLLLPARTTGAPATPEQLMETVRRGYGAYYAGEFGVLASLVPDLLRAARIAEHEHGEAAVAAPYAHAYDLGAALLIHTGRADAALAGVEKAILAARRGDDPYRPVSFMGTYAWVLLHQGRYQEAEDLVVAAAENIEPRMSTTDQAQLAAWGGLMMQAGVMAVMAIADTARFDVARQQGRRAAATGARTWPTAGEQPATDPDPHRTFGRTRAPATCRRPGSRTRSGRWTRSGSPWTRWAPSSPSSRTSRWCGGPSRRRRGR